jgi:hypothetical protein
MNLQIKKKKNKSIVIIRDKLINDKIILWKMNLNNLNNK